MANTILSVLGLVLILICVLLAFVFIVLPIPKNEGLREYKISLRILTISYFSLGVYFSIKYITEVVVADYFSFIFIAISSSQALLFTFIHIVLLNPNKIKLPYVVKSYIPLMIFIILHLASVGIFGNPAIASWTDWQMQYLHPTIIVRELLILTYIIQIVYLTMLFFSEEKKYDRKLDNFYADNFKLRLTWVRYSFIASLFIGILVIFTTVIPSIAFNLFFKISIIVFYLLFGLRFIQYPKIYDSISAILIESVTAPKQNKTFVWSDLKQMILDDKLYLQQGVTIEDIAKNLKVKRSTLSSLINCEEGTNFNTWINGLRVEEAKQLMANNPDFQVAQISEMVGYSEQSNFSRQFKKIAQVSPKLWRQNQIG